MYTSIEHLKFRELATVNIPSQKALAKQTGAALLVCFIMLLVFSLTLISGTNTSILEQKMASYAHEQVKTLHSADSAINVAMNDRPLMHIAKENQGKTTLQPVNSKKLASLAPVDQGIEPTAEIAYLLESPVPNASGSTDAILTNRHFVADAVARIEGGARTRLRAGFSHFAPQGTRKRLNLETPTNP